MLTKEKILGGIKNTKLIKLPMYDDEEIGIREINDFEYNTFVSEYRDVGSFDMISTMRGENIKAKEDTTKFKTSLKQMDKSKYDAKLNLAVKVLDNDLNTEKFNKKDLEQLKPGALNLIINETLKFSGLDSIEELEKAVKSFRKEE